MKMILRISFLVQCAVAFGSPSASNLSVSELKRLLNERAVDFRDCLEKRDLVERLESTKHLAPQPTQLMPHESRLISNFQKVSPAVAFITSTVRGMQRFSLQETEVPIGSGSGFLWDSKGHVVTNFHVVAAQGSVPKTLKVKLAGMAEAVEASVIGVEPEKDLAVLKIEARNLPRPLDIGVSADLQVGQSVLAIGNPFGLDNTLTTGVVSATGRDVQGIGGRPIKSCIQTDAAINPGNSGGPLLDSSGRLIGVNTAIYTGGGTGNVGIGFAIPVDTVRRVVNQIIRYGKVVRPTLGLNVVDDRIVRNIGYQLGKKLEGVLIAEVVTGSPAATANLQTTMVSGDGSIILGDLITHIDGEPVKQVEDLLSQVEMKHDGDIVRLTVERNGARGEVNIRLTSRDQLLNSAKRINGVFQ
mmetsp:Transcript_9439/g.14569  ORF Transcript_9439/g.14569 Transcript_9439/m.14569 type:complete len:414 (+) Transcript_9439:81-1322(+)